MGNYLLKKKLGLLFVFFQHDSTLRKFSLGVIIYDIKYKTDKFNYCDQICFNKWAIILKLWCIDVLLILVLFNGAYIIHIIEEVAYSLLFYQTVYSMIIHKCQNINSWDYYLL